MTSYKQGTLKGAEDTWKMPAYCLPRVASCESSDMLICTHSDLFQRH